MFLAIRERLAKSDPDNAGWQRDLSVSYERIGNVIAQGNQPEALQFYREGLAIRKRLAKSDPGNSGWQRDLAVVHSKVGVALQKMGEMASAREELLAGRMIMATLVEQNPGWAEWKTDLAWFDNQLAILGR